MAEHNGGNRNGKDRGSYGGGRPSGGGPYRASNNSGGDPRGFRAKDDRSDRPSREGADRKPFGDRPSREGGERRSFGAGDRDRKPFGAGDRDRKPFGAGDRDRKPFGAGDRDRKPFGAGDRDRKPFGDRPSREGGERRSFGAGDRDRKPFGAGDRDRKPFGAGDRDRDRKPFGDRPSREGGERRSFGAGAGDRDRKPFGAGDRDRDRKPFGDRPSREGGERRSFGAGAGDRDRKPFGAGDRDRKPFGDRPRREGDGERRSYGGGDNRKPFGDRQERAPRSFDRGDSGPRDFGRDRPEDRPARVPNARDLRSANRPDRERSPQIDEDVTGQELDRATKHEIKTLEPKSAEWVARHLVMAGRLIDEEPELAFQHALAASRRGGRLSAVREAVGLTAYAAGHYGEALREFRTYRRISGSNVHLPVMADCERGLGRPDRALDVARSEEANDLDAPGKVELAIVAAGARTDLGQLDAAVAELEIAQLDINRAFSYSPRLFRAYGDALAAVGRTEEAAKWQRQAVVAENALGLGEDEEPDIIDLGWDEEEEAREEEARRRLLAQQQAASAPAPSPGVRDDSQSAVVEAAASDAAVSDAAVLDEGSDDAEADYFESDDAESDEDSVEEDELEEGTSGYGTTEDAVQDAGDADTAQSDRERE
ncbi:tetratricopeptide (TPR) repeat protein [Arthrobacter sp. PvP023]|uniref:hypothetical protein n=2 Tax=Micrococcaceae TaxID=1268 RepID=UPI001B46325F|nr:hypothetical protein [Arthrobacter sp. PvP023]MBP1136835.1 tetratricopeptide (TPR) repeat protein [Arthrobacter sp. PvP023]